jgi:acyl dehydratase
MAFATGKTEIFKRSFTQDDLNRFARLSDDDNPIHVDPEFSARTRFGKTVVHGMMLYSTICRILHTKLPGPGTLQVSQQMTFRHPTFTETEITLEIEITNVRPEKNLAEIHTNIRLPDGNPACEGNTVVHLPGWKGGFHGLDQSMNDTVESEARVLKHLRLGQTASKKRIFSDQDLAEYADLTGDTNLLNKNTDFARQHGLTGPIIPGPLLSSMFSDLLGTKLPGKGTNWLKQQLNFPAPAYIGEEITAKVEIIRLRPAKNLVNLRGICTDSSGKPVCQGLSLVLVKDLE